MACKREEVGYRNYLLLDLKLRQNSGGLTLFQITRGSTNENQSTTILNLLCPELKFSVSPRIFSLTNSLY